MKNIGIIFAGGVGTRMHSKDLPKQFLVVHGRPIIIHTLELFEKNKDIDMIVVACVEEWIPYLKDLVYKYRIDKVKSIVKGGETGQLSIYNALVEAKRIVGDENAVVLIHDGVRPLIKDQTITDNINAVREKGSAITTGIIKETIIVVEDGEIKQVPNRKNSRVAKAPQSFLLDDILSAHNKALAEGEKNYIDSCTLMNAYGFNLNIIDGPYENIKITPDDYYLLKAILDAKEDKQIYGIEE